MSDQPKPASVEKIARKWAIVICETTSLQTEELEDCQRLITRAVEEANLELLDKLQQAEADTKRLDKLQSLNLDAQQWVIYQLMRMTIREAIDEA
jgi:hypothetical protein